jgi:hypothetical protein
MLTGASNWEWLTIERKIVAGGAFHLDNEPKLPNWNKQCFL